MSVIDAAMAASIRTGETIHLSAPMCGFSWTAFRMELQRKTFRKFGEVISRTPNGCTYSYRGLGWRIDLHGDFDSSDIERKERKPWE